MHDNLSRSGFLLVGILTLAFIVRFSYWSEYRGTALDEWHKWDQSDMATYVEQARRIAQGDWLMIEPYHPYHNWQHVAPPEAWLRWYGPHISHQAPAYSYLLALITSSSTTPFTTIKQLQLILGSISCILVFLITRHIAGLLAATVAGVLSAIYAPVLYLEAHLLREALAIFGLLLILLLLIRHVSAKVYTVRTNPGSITCIGIVIGIFMMLHQMGLLLLLIAMCVLVRYYWRCGYRKVLTSLGIVITGFVIGFSPWLVRNITVGAPLFSVSSRMPIVFVQSNEAHASLGGAYFVPLTENAAHILDKASGNPLRIVAGVWSSYEGNISHAFTNWFQRFIAIWERWEIYDSISLSLFRDMTHLLKFLPDFSIIFPLGLSGVALMLFGLILNNHKIINPSLDNSHLNNMHKEKIAIIWRQRKMAHIALFFFAIAVIGSLSLTHSTGRQRIYLIPYFLVYTGVFIEMLYQFMRERRLAKIYLIATLIVLAVQFQNYCSKDIWHGFPPLSHYLVAQDLAFEDGEEKTAQFVTERANRFYPDVPDLFVRLADWFEQRGNIKLAAYNYERAERIAPNDPNIQNKLATIGHNLPSIPAPNE